MIQKNGGKEGDTVEYVILIIYSHRGYTNSSSLNVTVFWLISHLELSDRGHTIKFSPPPKQGDHIKTPIRNSSWTLPTPELPGSNPCLGIDWENAIKFVPELYQNLFQQ